MSDVNTTNPENQHTGDPRAGRRHIDSPRHIQPGDRNALLPVTLQKGVERHDTKLQAELAEKKLSPEERTLALNDGRSKARALSYEWVQMQRFLPQETLEYIASSQRSRRSIEQLLEMRTFSSFNFDRVDNLQEILKRHVEVVNKWVEMQKVMDADSSGMRARVEKLKVKDIRELFAGALPAEDLLDKRDKNQRKLLEKRDIEKLLPLVLSEVEMRRVSVMDAKMEQHINDLGSSPREEEQALAKSLRTQIEKMDPGIYYNMLLGRIPPYELRIGIPADATGVTWELVRTAYVAKEDMQQILQGKDLKQWKEGYARLESIIEQRRPALEREWQSMMDHFYRERPQTYERLALMPAEMRYHLLSINLSPDHEIFTLRGHLQQVIAMLHPDDLYPFLQYRTQGVEPTFGANASWLRFHDIVHRLHEKLETGKTQCVGVDFFTGLPLYPPSRYSMIVLGVPGGGKTDNFVYVNLVQHQSQKEVLIMVDLKGDSASFVKEYLHKRNLGELTGMAAGAISRDHRMMIIGPGPDEGNLNILWYIPTTKEAEAKVGQLEALVIKEPVGKLHDILQGELAEARADLVSLKRKQYLMAVKVGAAWAKAAMKQDELQSLGHSNPALRKLYYQVLISTMHHLRLANADLPPLEKLRLINNFDSLKVLKDSPSEFARATYERVKNLGSEQRADLFSILSASTVMLDDPLVQEFTRTNSLDVEALLRPKAGKPPWAVAVNMHFELNTAELLNPVFESGFEVWHEVQKYAKIHSPEIHSNKLFFVMDEATNFATNSSSGKMHPKIEELVDVMRSLDGRFLGSTQSPNERVIPTDILGKVTLLIGSPDDATAEYVAKKGGITTRDMATSSLTHESMIGEQSGSRKPSIGWGFTSTESTQWRDIIQLMEGKTAQEVPLIYPHNLTQMPRNLGIMIVPGLAPSLYIPLNPRKSTVLKALRRMEPIIEQGPVVDSMTPKDMAAQLSAPEKAQVFVQATARNASEGWKESELTEAISHLEEEKQEREKQQAKNQDEELTKIEGIIVVNQIIKGLTKTLKELQDEEQRRREELPNRTQAPSNPA